MITRKNQQDLTTKEWNDFIDAINKTHGVKAASPAYRDFVKLHTRAMNVQDAQGMSWAVHTMGPMMPGKNFLAWHRRLLRQFEKRLQRVHATVAIPYWDAVASQSIPKRLADPALLASWGVTRQWNPNRLPKIKDMTALKTIGTFALFQPALEAGVHNKVHNAVGGDMASASSPSDPLFWLHHANIDRLWADWQRTHPGENPPNLNTVLQPPPLIGVKVSALLSISALGYRYA